MDAQPQQGTTAATLPRVALEPLKFASVAERTCSFMLETFVKDWRAIQGATFQVCINGRSCADFRIADCLIEFHPIILQRELSSSASYYKYQKILHQLPKWARQDLCVMLKSEFEQVYINSRRFLIASSPSEDIRRCELIVCTTQEEFYSKVIKRFVGVPPKPKLFKRTFEQLCAANIRRGYGNSPPSGGGRPETDE